MKRSSLPPKVRIDENGSLLVSKSLTAAPNGSATIAVEELLGKGYRATGYARLEYGHVEPGLLPAQLAVFDESTAQVSKYLFADLRNLKSRQWWSTYWLPSQKSRLTLFALNVGEEPVAVEVDLLGTASTGQTSFSLDRNSSGSFNLDPGRLRASRTGLLRISHRGKPGTVVLQLSVADEGNPSYNPALIGSAEGNSGILAIPSMQSGFHPKIAGRARLRPHLLLANRGAEPIEVRPKVQFVLDGQADRFELEPILLNPQETRLIDAGPTLNRHAAGATGLTSYWELSHDGVTDALIGAALSFDSLRSHLVYSKGVDLNELSPAFSYPLRMGGGWNTIIHLTNRSGQEVPICLTVFYDGRYYTVPVGRLRPFEVRVVDFNEFRDERIPGTFAGVLPADLESGQIKLVVRRPEDLDKVVAEAFLTEPEKRLCMPFSCTICPPDTVSLRLLTSLNDFFPEIPIFYSAETGDPKQRIVAVAFHDDGSREDVSIDANYNSTDSSIARVTKSFFNADVEFPGAGDALIGASVTGCQYSVDTSGCEFEPGPGGGCIECVCQEFTVSVPSELRAQVAVDPKIEITGPTSLNVGEPHTQLTTSKMPSTGTLLNWRVLQNAQSDPRCVDLLTSGQLKALSTGTTQVQDGSVQVQVDYSVNGRTATSQPFTVQLRRKPQVVRILWQSAADTVLQAQHSSTAINQIKGRVTANVQSMLTQGGANIEVRSTFPAGITQRITVSISGNGSPTGNAPFDLMNRKRNLLAQIRIGTGSLDLANAADPVMSTGVNERQDPDRVADAISRAIIHEIAHAVGLTAQNTELMNDNLAAKLMISTLGLGGSSSHHSGTTNWGEVMNSGIPINRTEGWNFSQYAFRNVENVYRRSILP